MPTGRTFAYVLRRADPLRQMPEIRILQTDVRAIQLAKAALYAGARLLMDKLGIDKVDRIKLAGAFGTYIDPKYAMVIGLVPDCPLDKVAGVGNAAGTGARMALLNKGYRREIEDAGAADREDRDGDRAALPGALRQRHGVPEQGGGVPEPRRRGEAPDAARSAQAGGDEAAAGAAAPRGAARERSRSRRAERLMRGRLPFGGNRLLVLRRQVGATHERSSRCGAAPAGPGPVRPNDRRSGPLSKPR